MTAGGKGGNAAYQAQRLGIQTIIVGCVGSDEFGHIARSLLKEADVDLSGVREVQGETGVAIIITEPVCVCACVCVLVCVCVCVCVFTMEKGRKKMQK